MLRKPKLQVNHMTPSALQSWLWLLLIRRRSELKNSSTKYQFPWRIVELNRRIILPLQDDMVCPSVLIICPDSWMFCLLICTPLSLLHSFTTPFGRPSASLENCSILPLCLSLFLVHSLIPPHHAFCISACCSRRDNTRRRSLFMRVSRKVWPVPQRTGFYSKVRVPRNLDCTLLP